MRAGDAVSLDQAMRLACSVARPYLGATSPNPAVGAVALDAEGRILATGAHAKAGTPHAERVALEACRATGVLDKIATLVVTLEPCNHHGRTGPCSEAILAARIPHVVIGTSDPNPHVRGGGAEKLRAAGVRVTEGVEEQLCRQLIHAFSYSMQTGLPWVTLKTAHRTDGSMIPPPGQKTFTSAASLCLAHRLRKSADAIVTGSGTILADRPLFTVRQVQDHPGRKRFLVILDRRRRVSVDYLAQATTNGFHPLIHDCLDAAMEDLAQRGVRHILAEAGPRLVQGLIESGLWAMHLRFDRTAQDDNVAWHFNTDRLVPFNPDAFDIENILP